MELLEAIKKRHSVRSFTDKKIIGEAKQSLLNTISVLNKESGLNMQLCTDESEAFGGMTARYGKFENCKNYIILAGKKESDERMGYYGQKIVLKAQQEGLNSCWVGLTYNKSKLTVSLNKDEKIRLVIALGYGTTQGIPHKSKDMMMLCKTENEMPDWFKNGIEAAILAPTALNQQKFLLTQTGNTVHAKHLLGFYTKVDLGIVKCHFEIGAGKNNFVWSHGDV